jgi:hypothetical protein
MNTEAAAARDAELKPILETMWELPYREIAEELSDRKMPRRVECDVGDARDEVIGQRGQMKKGRRLNSPP